MTAINHALTGSLIGLLSGEALFAVPAAIISHFICDALPHYGSLEPEQNIKSTGFKKYLLLDAALCGILVLTLAIVQPTNWVLAALCAFLAAAPDFLWINKFLVYGRGKTWKPNIFSRFAAGIQWFQRPVGVFVEVAWLIGCLVLMTPYLK